MNIFVGKTSIGRILSRVDSKSLPRIETLIALNIFIRFKSSFRCPDFRAHSRKEKALIYQR